MAESSLFGGLLTFAALATVSLSPGQAQTAPTPPAKAGELSRPAPKSDGFQFFTINLGKSGRPAPGPNTNLVLKGIAIKLGTNGGACFDTDRLIYRAAWRGDFINISNTSIIRSPQGSHPAWAGTNKVFQVAAEPGCSLSTSFESFDANASETYHYEGLYRRDDKTAIQWRAGKTKVVETASMSADSTFFRDFNVVSIVDGLNLNIFSGSKVEIIGNTARVTESDGTVRVVHAAFKKGRGTLLQKDGKVILHLENSPESIFRVSIGAGEKASESELGFEDPMEFTKGGPDRWPSISTRGKLGLETGAFQVDTLTIPESNPFDSWMRLTAIDFFKDGSAAVATMSGEVWVVSGIDRNLRMLSWKRYATGLFETLGLKIVNDQVYVLGKDRITKLVDINKNGEADYYESFNSQVDVYPTYHAYSFDLQTDSKTNFYFVTDGNMVDPDLPFHGSLVQVSADGKYANVYAKGMRAANGMGIGPEDQITTADNQGHWTPACRINWIKEGGFYGYGGDPRQTNLSHAVLRKTPTSYDPPLCWIPMNADNSSGSQVWVTSSKWGALRNHMLHLSYGKGTLFAVMPENAGGIQQGGVIQFPLKFASGMMRARFNAADGQLYVCGMKGWQTSAVRDGALQRVRYTGNPLHMPVELHVKGNNITIGFSEPLDKTQAQDAGNFAVEQWNYHWTSTYGSDNYSVENPDKKGSDKLDVKSARLLEDGKTVVLTLEHLQPAMQMKIKYQIKAADQTPLSQEIYNTINAN